MTPSLPPPQTILDLLPDAACVVSEDGRFLFVNAAFERVLGYPPADVVGRRVFDFIHPEDIATTLLQVEQIMAGQMQRHFRNRYVHKDGRDVHMQWSASWHQEYGVRIAVGREVTELYRAELKLEYLARHDQLTGLYNRHHLHQELHSATEHARASGATLGVFYIDLDGFKDINDRFGHEVGDQLLLAVATRLKGILKSSDTPARVGGDEFVVLMPNAHANDVSERGDYVRLQLSLPYSLSSGEVSLTASVGVALFPDDAVDAAALVAHADRDMYTVKSKRHA